MAAPDVAAARGTAGLAIEQHPDLPAEALALALRMRAALEVQGRTAALVTRDRQLARRVAAELRRWGIEVDDPRARRSIRRHPAPSCCSPRAW